MTPDTILNDAELCFDAESLDSLLVQRRTLGLTERLLTHFGRGCTHCWAALDEVVLNGIPGGEGTLTTMAAEAVRRIVLSRRGIVDPNLPSMCRFLLRPENWGKGFEFLWLVLQLTHPRSSHSTWREYRQALTHPDLVGTTSELVVLLDAFIARVFVEHGQTKAAVQHFKRWQILARSESCRPEIRATVLQVAADGFRRQGWNGEAEPLDTAWQYLEAADELLKSVDIPGRRAETYFRFGQVQHLRHNYQQAYEEYRKALDMIPGATHLYLRAMIVMHAAAALNRSGDHERSAQYIREAERIRREVSSPAVTRFHVAWQRGECHLNAGDLGNAERYLLWSMIIASSRDGGHGLPSLGKIYSQVEVADDVVQHYLSKAEDWKQYLQGQEGKKREIDELEAVRKRLIKKLGSEGNE